MGGRGHAAMIVYFLPGTGIFGGIKVAYQFVDALADLGVPAVIAAPEGRAATWFASRAPVVDRDEALRRWRREDTAVFSLPDDHADLRGRVDRLVFHCQGTDPRIDPVLEDASVPVLTCWRQAHDYVAAAGREPHDVGIAVAPAFHYAGQPKAPRSVVYLSRRGADVADRVLDGLAGGGVQVHGLDGLDEAGLADALASASVFLATARGEWFGLPALEAMAAGCVVLSVPVVGGVEFLRDGDNAVYGEEDHLRNALRDLLGSADPLPGQRMRLAAIATAHGYSVARHRERRARSLPGWLDG
jgi:glycosyltransferase involved in cell wall biosynthesis